jgi:hypothetical protein
VTYVVMCGARPPNDLSDAQRDASLWGQLNGGRVPAWLIPNTQTTGPFHVYRVRL